MLCSTNLKCANDVRKTCINESVTRKVSVRSGRCKHSATGIRNDDLFCHATKQYPEVLLACLAAGAACHLSTRKQAFGFRSEHHIHKYPDSQLDSGAHQLHLKICLPSLCWLTIDA